MEAMRVKSLHAACVAAIAWVGTAALGLEPPQDESKQVEALFDALLSPSLADGQVSDGERREILRTGRILLNDAQFAELERRLGEIDAVAKAIATASPEQSRAARSALATTDAQPASSTARIQQSEREAICLDTSSRPDGILDRLYLTATLDGFKAPVDFGLNAHFSFNLGVNWSCPIAPDLGLGIQVGTTVNFSDFLVPAFKSL